MLEHVRLKVEAESRMREQAGQAAGLDTNPTGGESEAEQHSSDDGDKRGHSSDDGDKGGDSDKDGHTAQQT